MLKIHTLCATSEKGLLNTEWMVVENQSDKPFNLEGCSISVSNKNAARPRIVTTFKAGISFQPKEKCRLVTGSSGKKSHGDAPVEEGVRNVHLFLKAPFIEHQGQTIRLMNRQVELCKATFDKDGAHGLKADAPSETQASPSPAAPPTAD